MSEETDNSTVESTVETTAPASTETTGRPAGYEPVDPQNSTPEQVQERINYLYSQVKNSDREKREMRNILAEQSKLLTELSTSQNAVVNHLQDKSITETESSLRSQMKSAWEKGDNDTYFALQDKLDDLRIEKKMAAKNKPATVQQQPQNASQYAQQAQGTGELSETEYRITETWQNETDDSGNLIRPWAFGNDPNHRAALVEAQAVFNNPRYANMSYEKKLEEVDKRMGTAKRSVSQAVMGGNLTTPTKTSKLTLTPKQQEIAIKTKYAGAGKTEAEHLEAYRKQVQSISQRRSK